MGTSDRRPYLSATTVDQNLLDQCQDNLNFKLEMIAEIYNVGTLSQNYYISDRAKYVGSRYYEARTTFPSIQRTVGDWLSNELEFSSLDLTIANPDGYFNDVLPSGSYYNSWVGKRVILKIGLGEIASSYIEVFSGTVTEVAGFSRRAESFSIKCRNDFDLINKNLPNQSLTNTDWPYLEDEFVGLLVPVIYGDWTVNLKNNTSTVPAFVVNGLDPLVNASLDPPNPNVGDTAVRCVIASVPLKSVDTGSVVLLRGDQFYEIPSGDISIVAGSDNQAIDIAQKGFQIDSVDWIYETGDLFYLKCVGVDLLTWTDNIVYQAKDILKRFGGLTDIDFTGNWLGFAGKSTPSGDDIINIKSRVWVQEDRKALEYALSMLEQVRLEIFIDRNGYFDLSSLHFSDMIASPSYSVKQWDMIRGSLDPSLDEMNQFNRAKADYNYQPLYQSNVYSTVVYRNQANITQTGREISKLITFPNLYDGIQVDLQVIEILKLAAYIENIEIRLTPRAFLLDLSDEIALNINLGGVVFENIAEPVTGKIRSINYEPNGTVIAMKIWSLQMVPFPGSLKSGISGITGGSTATITPEV